SFEDSGRSDDEYSKDEASFKEGGFETPHVRRSIREYKAPVRYSSSANYLLLTKNEPDVFLGQITSRKEGITKLMDVQGSNLAEFNKPKWQLPLVFEMKDRCSEKQVGDERKVEVLPSFSWPPSELITEDDVLPERGYSQFNDVSSGYL
ncbi:hypothetical protein Tco_1389949, partial [Tanacetum coccineum]